MYQKCENRYRLHVTTQHSLESLFTLYIPERFITPVPLRIFGLQLFPGDLSARGHAYMLVVQTKQANEKCFVIDHQHTGLDVTCKPSISNNNIVPSKHKIILINYYPKPFTKIL